MYLINYNRIRLKIDFTINVITQCCICEAFYRPSKKFPGQSLTDQNAFFHFEMGWNSVK